MFDAQSDGLSSTLAYVTYPDPSSTQATAPCEAAPPSATPSMSPMLFSADAMAGRTVGESGDVDHPISRMAAPIRSQDGHSQETNRPTMPTEQPQVSFEELAVRYRQNQHKQTSRKRLENRLHALKVSMGVSARLLRVGSVVQRGLVDRLKHDDKVNFIALYHTMADLQESCDSAFRRHFHRQDPLEEWSPIRESAVDHSPDFFLQLSPQSRTDLVEILHLVRTDPQFILDRLYSLAPAQLAALVSSAGPSGDPSDISFHSASRSRNPSSFSKRVSASTLPFKDRVLAFERTDALSILLFNVYASPLDSDAPEAQLRLDVWSSVCAKLITDGGSRYYPLIGQILGSWATGSDWKAKPKFELYLMDILQTGAFLLEHLDTPPGVSFDADPPDPLKTDVAEEFFASAVDALFQLLDDPDGGFPHAVMQLGCAILQKLDHQDGRDRFLEFLFVQWFFSKFLYGALTYPEAHGLLLDFHIRNDAREKLLGQVGLRAYSQVFAVLRSMHHVYMIRPTVRQHVENMLCRYRSANTGVQSFPRTTYTTGRESPAAFLMLSAADIVALLNALFPRSPASACSSPLSSSGMPSSPVSSLAARSDRSIASILEPGFFKPVPDHNAARVPHVQSLFPADMAFLSLPENCMSRNADRIRFELSDLSEPDGRTTLEQPAAEEWSIFSMSQRGKRLTWGLFPEDGQFNFPDTASVDDAQSTTLGMEDNFEALQTAIVKLIQDNPADDCAEYGFTDPDACSETGNTSLKQRFDRAMEHCHHDSDFIGAHYWWNAGRQLLRSVASSQSRRADDSWILEPMHASCVRSLATSRVVIERCESDFVALNRHAQRLQRSIKEMMTTVAKLRDKMWYMTDVRNSMRYEDAKHVALALKTMIYSARLYKQAPNEGRSRGSTRSFGSSLLQKPELQVMNIMKAPSSQGGPNKLSDEQVDLIRKWLSHNNIDNFCKGEERIHRFCYEVKASINRLVGESMAETPVLWASELYHKERAKYEGSSNRGLLSLSSSLRPFGASSEDSAYASQAYGSTRPSDTASKFSQDLPPLNRKSSFQSVISDKWRVPRDPSIADTSSIGGSPGRAASTTTGDSYSTFWSTPQPAHYAPSTSSFYSRPPSMFGDNGAPPPRRNDRKTHGKAAFLEDLKQTLTSLLLSDLGSPVWSCGSETDAWFENALDQKRIQTQMKKRARIQRFYTQCDERLVHQSIHRTPSDRRRSKSLESSERATLGDAETPSSAADTAGEPNDALQFSYGSVFRRLIEVFSRHGNPFVKLKALRDLRALVVASLNSANEDTCKFDATEETTLPRGRNPGLQGKRSARHSFSDSQAKRSHSHNLPHSPISPAAESVIFDSRPSDYCAPTETQIVDALRDLLLEVKPKTLFRDLQFISAFVPGETLNKTDSGTAFLQFGLAALSLKDEICNSMVEIADNIVSQELSRRHPPPGHDTTARTGHAIEDAAGMWIITAKEGNPVAQRELAILYLTHPELLPRVTLPLTLLRDTFKAEMMYRRDKDSKSDPQSMCLALHWMQLSANGGDELARNRLREREEFESIA
ncbi:hypothetical protein BO70DRAFT_397056 [Aspergillus heteromorphus CBS 117.55]|uniref:Uncharacterized protein n=1 Tax=Aspergillus heteromorphus CBS 117.55 TaxID=1448321 RepID=A0A317VZ83_9EURO|nr:uncharacterized protein BO70DRAFT_397056 [Aspergillus heteromorphus CBS 117.55]PWY79573.1 hypothetical protein BO70DRAFT_397056 [Aspergillus heteromorphus CBS 117.55]